MPTITLRKLRETSPDTTEYRVTTAGVTKDAVIVVTRALSLNPGTPKSGGTVRSAFTNQILGPDGKVARVQPTALKTEVSVPTGVDAANVTAQNALHDAIVAQVKADLIAGFLPGDTITVTVA